MNPEPIPREELLDRLCRSFKRYRFCVDAELALNSRRIWARVRDISRGGMFIETKHPFRVDQKFYAYLALDNPLALDCRIRRVEEGYGVGVTLSVPSLAKLRFEALLLALAGGANPATAAVKTGRVPPQLTKAVGAGSMQGGSR